VSARLTYGAVLRQARVRRNGQRILFLRYLSPRERGGRSGGGNEFLGMTIKPASTPLGDKKMGQVEFFPERGWVRDE
jgi:hypothetical protein